jgi:hypothetical protein
MIESGRPGVSPKKMRDAKKWGTFLQNVLDDCPFPEIRHK